MKSLEGESPLFKNLEIFKMAHAMAVHAGQKQAVAAENVANSDTPEFKAQDIAPFGEVYRRSHTPGTLVAQKSTRPSHMHGVGDPQVAPTFEDPDGIGNPNGNTVSLETEMLKSLDAKRQHDRALAIYKSNLGMLRMTLRGA